MFRIKICGITNLNDACAAAAAGADAIGLNFYNKSKRFIEYKAAQAIVGELPTGVMTVGIFVNHEIKEITKAIKDLKLDYVQLHGDEPPAFLSAIPEGVKILRAFRCGRDRLQAISGYLAECQALRRMPDAVLLDADATTAFGGTGQVADWNAIAQQRDVLGDLPLILAGGLTPDNVAHGIRVVRPDAVDVASGVEASPRHKDEALVHRFVAAARAAFS
jgi:phosphoribosylanthranilate isomerase